jgi:hypothetical protein
VRKTLAFFSHNAALHMNMDPFKNVGGRPLLRLFCEDPEGRYRTQFDTGTSGGSTNLDARRGWERRLFGDAYDGHDSERPKYGNVNFLAHMEGDRAAGQYGESFLFLRPEVRNRCTITSKDSSHNDARIGTLQHCAHVLLHMIEMCPPSHRPKLVEVLHLLGDSTNDKALAAIGARIDGLRRLKLHYVELQIHGAVRFSHDVLLVVAADGAASGSGRLALSSDQQAQHWKRFAECFHVQAFRMLPNGMVPLC